MPDFLTVFKGGMISDVQNTYIANQLLALNKTTKQSGIVLTKSDCAEIAQCRGELLVQTERIEVGAGAVSKIIEMFCDSGYVDQRTFKDTVNALLECFYEIKTQTDDNLDDEAVLGFLLYMFENEVGGDVSKICMSTAYDDFIRYGKYGDLKKKKHQD